MLLSSSNHQAVELSHREKNRDYWLNSKKCVAGMIGFTRVGEKESV